MSSEEWADVPGKPGLEASSHGRLRVKPYVQAMPHGGVRVYGGTPTSGQWDGSRFIYRFKGKTYRVARLICAAFSGPAPDEAVCMHMDEDPRNNKPSNLAWGTQQENLNAPGFLAYCRSRLGDSSPWRKGAYRKLVAGLQ